MTSLKRNAVTETPVDAAPTDNAEAGLPAVRATEEVALVNNGSSSSEDYVASGDIVIPSLKLVHPLSPLASDFDEASIVLNKESVLSDGTVPVKLTVVSKKRYFRERTEFDGGKKPTVFFNEADMRKAGGTTEWINDQPPSYDNVLDCVVAIESDKEDPNLPFEFNGKFYAIALWSLHGKAFKKAGTLIQTASQWSLKDGLVNGSWTLTTQKEKLKKGVAINPVLKAGPKNSPEVVAFLKSLTNS